MSILDIEQLLARHDKTGSDKRHCTIYYTHNGRYEGGDFRFKPETTPTQIHEWLIKHTVANTHRIYIDFHHANIDGNTIMPYFDLDGTGDTHLTPGQLAELIKSTTSAMLDLAQKTFATHNKSSFKCIVTQNMTKRSYHMYYYLLRLPRDQLRDFAKKVIEKCKPLLDQLGLKGDTNPYGELHMRIPYCFSAERGDLRASLVECVKDNRHLSAAPMNRPTAFDGTTGQPIRPQQEPQFCPWLHTGLPDADVAVDFLNAVFLTSRDLTLNIEDLKLAEDTKRGRPKKDDDELLDVGEVTGAKNKSPPADPHIYPDLRDQDTYFDPRPFVTKLQAIIDQYGTHDCGAVYNYVNSIFVINRGNRCIQFKERHEISRQPGADEAIALKGRSYIVQLSHPQHVSKLSSKGMPYWPIKLQQSGKGKTKTKAADFLPIWVSDCRAAAVTSTTFIPCPPSRHQVLCGTSLNLWTGYNAFDHLIPNPDFSFLGQQCPLWVFLDFVHANICNNMLKISYTFLDNIRRALLYPDIPLERIVIIIGEQGGGKTLIITFLCNEFFGRRHATICHASSSQTSSFQDATVNKTQIFIDEANMSRDQFNIYKALATATDRKVNKKGIAEYQEHCPTTPTLVLNHGNTCMISSGKEIERRLLPINTKDGGKYERDRINNFINALNDPDLVRQLTLFLAHAFRTDLSEEWRHDFFVTKEYNKLRREAFSPFIKYYSSAIKTGGHYPSQYGTMDSERDPAKPSWLIRVGLGDFVKHVRDMCGHNSRLDKHTVQTLLETECHCTFSNEDNVITILFPSHAEAKNYFLQDYPGYSFEENEDDRATFLYRDYSAQANPLVHPGMTLALRGYSSGAKFRELLSRAQQSPARDSDSDMPDAPSSEDE